MDPPPTPAPSPAGCAQWVCGWDLGHNAAGRAHTLAELHAQAAPTGLMGCLDGATHAHLWEPIRDTALPLQALVVDDWSAFVRQARHFVEHHPCRLLHLSKPRGPNLVLGLLYKQRWSTTVLMDIDDEELSFVGDPTPTTLDGYVTTQGALPPWHELRGADWTRIAVGHARDFDAVTVSNPALQQRYGGLLLAHARDGSAGPADEANRQRSRAALGLPAGARVVLFFGTPRAHKGLLHTAHAMASLRCPNAVFTVVGEFPDPNLQAALLAVPGIRVHLLGNQPFGRTPAIVAAADACVLMQDLSYGPARWQMPAKISDALAMGVPVIASAAPALQPLVAAGALEVATPASLATVLDRLLLDPGRARDRGLAGRRYFDAHLSFAAQREPLDTLLRQTVPRPLSPALQGLLAHLG